jgi:hypothetical protein
MYFRMASLEAANTHSGVPMSGSGFWRTARLPFLGDAWAPVEAGPPPTPTPQAKQTPSQGTSGEMG